MKQITIIGIRFYFFDYSCCVKRNVHSDRNIILVYIMLYLIHFPLSGLPSTHSSSFPLFFLCRVFHWPSIILPSSFIMSHSTVLLLSGIQDDFTFVLLRFYWGGDLQDDFTFVLLCCYWRVSDLQNISHSFYCVVIGE